jgi:surfactin synthase thioesterase subunit
MITKEQADAASQILLQDGLAAQAAQIAKLARRRQALFAFRWASIGALLAFSLDEFFSNHFTDRPHSLVILAIALGLAVQTAREMRRA